ncbi:MAG: hypothetical protein Q9157_003739 [Trypethelium eluteriae]
MSGFSTDQSDAGWQSQRLKSSHISFTPGDETIPTSSIESSNATHHAGLQAPSLLRSYRSAPFLFDSVAQATSHSNDQIDQSGGSSTNNSNQEAVDGIANRDQTKVTDGKAVSSAPASPISGRSHTPPKAENDEDPSNEFQDLDFDLDDDDDPEQSGIKSSMTAAEIRAQKRKMKRFSDDRERMMSSRALPENFDMTQALHSPFGAVNPANPNVGTPLASPAAFGANYPGQFPGQLPNGGVSRPLTLDTGFRRGPDNSHMSPTGISPALSAFAFTPPQSATDTMSPVSTSVADASSSPFAYAHTPPSSFGGSPKRPNPFAGPYGANPNYPAGPAQHKIPRLNIYDRMGPMGRSRAESLQSPLRTSISYSNMGNNTNQHSTAEYSNPRTEAGGPFNEDGPRTLGQNNSSTPYGIGYSYGQIPGFQAAASSRNRSFSSGAPRRIELPPSSLYRPSLQRVNSTPQTATFPSYQSQPLATPPAHSQAANMSAPYNITQFPNSYLRQDESQQQHYSPVHTSFAEQSYRGITAQHEHGGAGLGNAQHF